MQDIQSRADIEHLVRAFYAQVIEDDEIGKFFTEIVKVDWDNHFPKMFDFWESTIFKVPKYSGHPMRKHLVLNQLEKLKPNHFDRWLTLWETTLDMHFSGPNAEEARKRAHQIAQLIQLKIERSQNSNSIL